MWPFPLLSFSPLAHRGLCETEAASKSQRGLLLLAGQQPVDRAVLVDVAVGPVAAVGQNNARPGQLLAGRGRKGRKDKVTTSVVVLVVSSQLRRLWILRENVRDRHGRRRSRSLRLVVDVELRLVVLLLVVVVLLLDEKKNMRERRVRERRLGRNEASLSEYCS